MERRRFLLLVLLSVFFIGFPPSAMRQVAHTYARGRIQHIIFILKENRTFDSMFGLFPGANGTTTGVVKVNGRDKTIPLNPAPDQPHDFCHEWKCAHTASD